MSSSFFFSSLATVLMSTILPALRGNEEIVISVSKSFMSMILECHFCISPFDLSNA